jgi:hypothetical protein
MTTIRFRSAVLILATILMTGRMRPLTAQGAPTPVDACTLVTVQEASAVMGGQVKPPKPGRTISSTLGPGLPTAVSGCTFDTGQRNMTVGVRHTLDSAAGGLKQMIQVVCQGKQAIADVGDQACSYSAQHGELQAVKGATFLTIELSSGPDIGTAIYRRREESAGACEVTPQWGKEGGEGVARLFGSSCA